MRSFYRVVSGTMRALVWADNDKQAIRIARDFRNWRELGVLTKFQKRMKNGKDWGQWFYIETKVKP